MVKTSWLTSSVVTQVKECASVLTAAWTVCLTVWETGMEGGWIEPGGMWGLQIKQEGRGLALLLAAGIRWMWRRKRRRRRVESLLKHIMALMRGCAANSCFMSEDTSGNVGLVREWCRMLYFLLCSLSSSASLLRLLCFWSSVGKHITPLVCMVWLPFCHPSTRVHFYPFLLFPPNTCLIAERARTQKAFLSVYSSSLSHLFCPCTAAHLQHACSHTACSWQGYTRRPGLEKLHPLTWEAL